MNKIIPTVFAENNHEFKERFSKEIGIAKKIQIDIMDGKFVKTKSISVKDLPNLTKYAAEFEAHLMVQHPEKYPSLLKKKGFSKIIIHYESFWNNSDIIDTLNKIRSLRMKSWVAINPETSVAKVIPLLNDCDGILLMGVHPGKEHQPFVHRVYHKIIELKKINQRIKVQIDGGVNPSVAHRLSSLNVDYINSGSFISNSENPRRSMEILRKA
jgi:ribulose-phosphate 3-epimerase